MTSTIVLTYQYPNRPTQTVTYASYASAYHDFLLLEKLWNIGWVRLTEFKDDMQVVLRFHTNAKVG